MLNSQEIIMEGLNSRKIEELKFQLQSEEKSEVLASFWKSVEGNYPIFEPYMDDPEYYLVTLLYRSYDPLDNVFLLANIHEIDPAKYLFTHIPGTDVYYKTVKLHATTRTAYRILENDPLTGIFAGAKYGSRWDLMRTHPDPLNPKINLYNGDISYSDAILELPEAPSQPFIDKQSNLSGSLFEFEFESEILGNKRKITIYTPNEQFSHNESLPFILQFDGELYSSEIPTPIILDNLIEKGLIPPIACVLFGNAKDVNGQSIRNEELTCNDNVMRCIIEELLPYLHKHFKLWYSDNVISGSSFGGLMATYIAFKHPEAFCYVLSQSGSFWFNRDSSSKDYEWLPRQFAFSEDLPLKLYLEVGLLESEYGPDEPYFPHQVISHRHFSTILQMKGYGFKYSEYMGGHDTICWRGSYADGLIYLIGNTEA